MLLVRKEIHCWGKSWTLQSINNHLFTLKVFLKPVIKQENSSWVHQDMANAKMELAAWTLPELRLLTEKLYFFMKTTELPTSEEKYFMLSHESRVFRSCHFSHSGFIQCACSETPIAMRHTKIAVLGISTELSIKWSIIKQLTGFPSVSASALY